jgi:hypothetical protein
MRATQVTHESSLAKAAQLWFAEMESFVDEGRRSPGTLETYRSIYRGHVEPALGAVRLGELTTPIAEQAISAIKKKSTSRARTAKVVLSGIML